MIKKLFDKRAGEDDNEMSFIDHLEALRWHVIRSLIVVIILAVVIFINIQWFFDYVIAGPINKNFVSYRMLCKLAEVTHISALCVEPVTVPMQTTTYAGQFLGSFSIAFIGAFVLAFPYIFWEFWRFVKPALNEKELKSSGFAIFWVSFFFFTGAAFGYFILGPFVFSFLANFQISGQEMMKTIPTLNDYIDNLTNIVLGCGIAFELPVLSYVLTRVGLVTPGFLKRSRKYAIVIILILAAFITPSPDMISQLIVFIPLMSLYEFGIIVSKRVYKKLEEEDRQWS